MRALVFLLSVLIGSCTTDFPAEKDVQEAVVTAHKLKYLLYLPDDYESRDSWPLILFLHGAGERGDSLELVKIHGPPKLIAEGKKFPFIVVSPQVPQDEWWKPEVVLDLLDFLEDKYRVDQTRIYLTGLSMGGVRDLASCSAKSEQIRGYSACLWWR